MTFGRMSSSLIVGTIIKSSPIGAAFLHVTAFYLDEIIYPNSDMHTDTPNLNHKSKKVQKKQQSNQNNNHYQ